TMRRLTRRQLLTLAASIGASAAWAGHPVLAAPTQVRERRDLYPEGVASGDPDATSVIVWTRRPMSHGSEAGLRVEVAEDQAFTPIGAPSDARVLAAADWTCRVIVGNLQSRRTYWYRFIDGEGNASRVGRTQTAPSDDDTRPVRFAFASCQNINV